MTKRTFVLLIALLVLLGTFASAEEEDAKLAKVLEAAKADATRIRELPFLQDIPVRRITAEDLVALMMRDVGRIFGGPEKIAAMEALLQELRVLPEGTGLSTLVKEFFPETVTANYDPFTRRISFLRDIAKPKKLKSVMVHELTHALQDQHFNLSFLFQTGDLTFDRVLAFGALVEGDAENVQHNFDMQGLLSMMPLPMIREFGEGEIRSYLARMKEFPMGVARAFIFQYFDGLLFVETVKRAGGGFPAVDRMYRDPPVTTEQILHPGKYLHRDHPTRILPPDPPEGWRLLIENSLGELGVSIVLREHLGEDLDAAAAEGWDGDLVQLFEREDGRRMLVWYATWDTPEDAQEFTTAARAMFLSRRPGELMVVSQPGNLELQNEGERAHAILTSGRDVLLVEGLDRKGAAKTVQSLAKARMKELKLVNAPFGGRR